ncbi:HAD-IIIA family hydrolase [Candidatus Daviesbacteria bacterium]|nr:HAD-IIIA family hydrolase [Candidatus Daviesbacteria bacterium]
MISSTKALFRAVILRNSSSLSDLGVEDLLRRCKRESNFSTTVERGWDVRRPACGIHRSKLRCSLFLDRDGIIVKKVDGEAPRRVDNLHLIREIIPVIKKAKELGFLNIIVSNQPDVALGKITEPTKTALEKKFRELIRNLPVEAVLYCHHHPKATVAKYRKNCDCRKPKPGMILKAAGRYQIDMTKSFMLGDRASDVAAGIAVGACTILYDPHHTQKKYLQEMDVEPHYNINSLHQVIDILCKQ